MNRTRIISLAAVLVFATSFFSGCNTSNDAATQPVMGFSSGNMNNGGIAATQGDWVYFNPGEAHYKEKLDGSERTLIIHDDASDINVAGDWIYYSRSDHDSQLFKVRTDGTEQTTLFGLREDGTVIAAFAKTDLMLNPGKFDVNHWKDIVSVAAGGDTWGYNLLART